MSDSESEVDNVSSHSAALKRLQSKDPDFYEFLKENDQELLEFHNLESEEDKDGEEDKDDERHKDDERDHDGEGVTDVEEKIEKITKTKPITESKLKKLKQALHDNPSISVCKELIAAFRNAVMQSDGLNDKKVDMSGSELHNDVIKLGLIELVPTLRTVLRLQTQESSKKTIDPSKAKLWGRLRLSVKGYLIDLTKLLNIFKEPVGLKLLLRHVIHLLPFYSKFIKLSKLLLKRVVSLWSTQEEAVRVLALLVVVRLVSTKSGEQLSIAAKVMHLAYVRNTRFTSPSSWPMINFMKHSMTQVYALNPAIAYSHAFVYLRQLSIHLRNALSTRKKEAFQTVYNWQYVHCLLLWTQVLCSLQHYEPLRGLLYPLVQTIIGTIQLVPTLKYLPLRLQLVKALIQISKETDTFVPVLPFLLEVLTITDYNKKSTFSTRPVDLSCILKVTKSQLVETGFKDSCIATFCELLTAYLAIHSHEIGFPELVLPALLQIRTFTKRCRIAKYNQQLKAVTVTISETSSFVSDKRRAINFKITDGEQVKLFEKTLQQQGTPLACLQKTKEKKKASESERTPRVEPKPKKRKYKR